MMNDDARLRKVEVDVGIHGSEISDLKADMNTLSKAVSSLRNAILMFTVTIAGSAIAALLTVFEFANKH